MAPLARLTRFAFCACVLAGCAASPAGKPSSLREIYSSALAGDLSQGAAMLRAIDPSSLPEAERARRECLVARFVREERAPAKSGDELLDGLLELYRQYWTDSLLRRRDKAALETSLLVGIDGLSYHYARVPPTGSLDQSASRLVELLKARGSHAITGVTTPYYELMAWRSNEDRHYDIALPEGTVKVEVVLMNDFSSLGWSAWATCDRAFSGGWATKEAIFAVRPSYDLESESYRVSLLAHEGQHFSDYATFPNLEQPELEYRAKLAEIALSRDTTRELLENFASQAEGDRSSPHNMANGQLVRDLKNSLGGQDPLQTGHASVRAAATALLKANTADLKRRGAAEARRWMN